ncbi:glucan endo-1,3-beta-glucosidase 4-like protein [Tanacetum coccineum]
MNLWSQGVTCNCFLDRRLRSKSTRTMRFEMLLGYFLLMYGSFSVALGGYMGINIGTDLSDLPSPEQVVAILRSHQITHIRLFDADNHLLSALSDTGIEVMVSVSNDEVLRIGQSPAAAASWINRNIAAFVPSTNITAIAVGSEVLSAIPNVAPVNGIFPIEYALFQPLSPVKQIVDPNTLFHYDSMFDAMVDAAYNSIAAYNGAVIPIVVTETGWPWAGGANERDATVENAEKFNNNLIQRVMNDSGPPSQLTIPINAYIYELFNEDKKPGPLSEKSYGVYFSNGTSVYTFNLGTSGDATANASSGFCVARKGADTGSLQDGLNWACGPGQANCSAIQSGQPCFMPDTLENHASFAYNDYYQRMRSYGSCIFTGSTNSSIGGLVPPAFGPEGASCVTISPRQLPEIWSLLFVTVVLLVL